MKVVVGYPALPSEKGVALVSQNRQFQYFNQPTYIYPVVPAYLATQLKQNSFEVDWLDGVAEEWSYDEYLAELEKAQPDLLLIESKTPTIKRFWRFVHYVKSRPEFKNMKIAIMGDHVTGLPRETMENAPVDFVLTGGDFDFAGLNLAKHLRDGTPLEPGVWQRDRETGAVIDNGKFQITGDLTQLPLIDRELSRWWLYAYKNGNFQALPGTYTMIGRDCWWRKPNKDSVSEGVGCTFCSWTSTFPKFRSQTPEQFIAEIENCVRLGIKDVFDDTGTFVAGPQLKKICEMLIERGLNKKIYIGCNMRANALNEEQYKLMGKANFKFILYGVESGSQRTLDMLNKGTRWNDIKQATKWASQAGLRPHLTCMVGYPWETKEEAQRTIGLARELFDKGYVYTLQATICMPYPGTQLYKQAIENGWLKTMDYEAIDMREPVMISPVPDEEIYELTQGLYKAFMTPRYVLRRIARIRNWDDFYYVFVRAPKHLLGHLLDFSASGNAKLRAAGAV